MRYRLRTLLIVLAVGPPILAVLILLVAGPIMVRMTHYPPGVKEYVATPAQKASPLP